MVILAGLLLGLPSASAASNDHTGTLVGTTGALAGPPSAGGSVGGRVRFHLGDKVSAEAGAREGLASNDKRTMGTVNLNGRYLINEHVAFSAGFAHHHETPWPVFIDEPMLSFLGTSEGIRHRSGAQVSIGREWDLLLLSNRTHAGLELSVAAFPDDKGPQLYGFLEFVGTIDVGPSRK